VAYIDFDTAVSILDKVGVQVPSDITDLRSLKAWLDMQEQELGQKLNPLMRKLRVVRAIGELISD